MFMLITLTVFVNLRSPYLCDSSTPLINRVQARVMHPNYLYVIVTILLIKLVMPFISRLIKVASELPIEPAVM